MALYFHPYVFLSSRCELANRFQAKAKKKASGPVSQALGPDALRLWVASSDCSRDIAIGPSVLLANHTALIKYRLTLKMLLGSLHAQHEAPLTKLDQIALLQLGTTILHVINAHESTEHHKAVTAINKYITGDLSAFYIESMKDRLYCGDGGGVLPEIFHAVLCMLAPIVPHLVEEAWEFRPEWMRSSPDTWQHPARFPLSLLHSRITDPAGRVAESGHIEHLMAANTAVKAAQEEARADKKLGSSLESVIVLRVPPLARPLFDVYAEELATMFVVSGVELLTLGEGEGRQKMEQEGKWKYESEFETEGGTAKVVVSSAVEHKCPRCWRFVAPAEDELCARCEEIVQAKEDVAA